MSSVCNICVKLLALLACLFVAALDELWLAVSSTDTRSIV